VVTWAVHPYLIPVEIGAVILESEEPSVVGAPPLFLHADEVIHSKIDTLQHRVLIHILEIHDFSPAESLDEDPLA
jgi:hypothetical protein